MSCTPDAVDFRDNGEDIYFKKTDCSLVKHWADKYCAEVKVEWIPEMGAPLLFDFDTESVVSMDRSLPGSEWRKGDTVWAVPSSTMGAFRDADFIKRFVSTADAKEYDRIHQSLLKAGYPDDVLDEVPSPR